MKKIVIVFVGLLICMPSYAKDYLFNKYNNSLSVSGSKGIKKTNNMYIKNIKSIQYSQPHELFRLTGRMNIEGIYALGENNDYTTYAAGLSHDVLLLKISRMYLGVGAGIYFRNKISPNLGSRFAFGAKAFAGLQLTNFLGFEAYMNHFSNGDLNRPNIGEEYVGASLILYY